MAEMYHIDARCSAVVCNLLVKTLDTDNLYIKIRILRNIEKIKDVVRPTNDYILQKVSLDTNFMVLRVYLKIIDGNKKSGTNEVSCNMLKKFKLYEHAW